MISRVHAWEVSQGNLQFLEKISHSKKVLFSQSLFFNLQYSYNN